MEKILLLMILLLTVSCAKFIDGVHDELITSSQSVKSARIECYSAGGKFFDYTHDGRIWENKNGGYRIAKSNELITVNGDCVLTEKF